MFRFLSAFVVTLALAACTATPDGTAPGADAAPSEPARPLPGLGALKAANPDQLIAVLGEPALKRTDADAQLWQYKGPTCVLALYLYDTHKEMPPTVTHMEAHNGKGAAMDTETCFHAILREQG